MIWRRVRWRLHWAVRPGMPFVIDEWWDGMSIRLLRSGSSAVVFYRTFPSAVIARWMTDLLGPGMTTVDVGAHVGVYSLLAARLVGPTGAVHAIEPQRTCTLVVDENAERNDLTALRAHWLALADADGEVAVHVDARGGGITKADRGAERVPARTLTSFMADVGIERVDLLKLDAAGNELAVLHGGRKALERGAVSNVISKLYHPRVTAERFGTNGGPQAVVDLLDRSGFDVVLPDGRPAERDGLTELFDEDAYTVPVLARKRT